MSFGKVTNEHKDKARTLRSEDELFALAEEEAMELSDDQLEGVAGGVEGLSNETAQVVDDRLEAVEGSGAYNSSTESLSDVTARIAEEMRRRTRRSS